MVVRLGRLEVPVGVVEGLVVPVLVIPVFVLPVFVIPAFVAPGEVLRVVLCRLCLEIGEHLLGLQRNFGARRGGERLEILNLVPLTLEPGGELGLHSLQLASQLRLVLGAEAARGLGLVHLLELPRGDSGVKSSAGHLHHAHAARAAALLGRLGLGRALDRGLWLGGKLGGQRQRCRRGLGDNVVFSRACSLVDQVGGETVLRARCVRRGRGSLFGRETAEHGGDGGHRICAILLRRVVLIGLVLCGEGRGGGPARDHRADAAELGGDAVCGLVLRRLVRGGTWRRCCGDLEGAVLVVILVARGLPGLRGEESGLGGERIRARKGDLCLWVGDLGFGGLRCCGLGLRLCGGAGRGFGQRRFHATVRVRADHLGGGPGRSGPRNIGRGGGCRGLRNRGGHIGERAAQHEPAALCLGIQLRLKELSGKLGIELRRFRPKEAVLAHHPPEEVRRVLDHAKGILEAFRRAGERPVGHRQDLARTHHVPLTFHSICNRLFTTD